MRRLIFAVVLLAALPAWPHDICNLNITLSCPPLRPGQTATCTSTTMNAGPAACIGEYFTGFFVDAPVRQVTLSDYNSGLGLTTCLSSGDFGETESTLLFCFGTSSLAPGASFTGTVKVSPLAGAPSVVPIGAFTGVYDPDTFDELAFVFAFNDVDLPTCTLVINVPPVTRSGVDYTVSWAAGLDTTSYELQESTSADFTSGVTSFTVNTLSRTIRKDVTNTTTFHYRVRPVTCGGAPGVFSAASSIVVQAPAPADARNPGATVPLGSTTPVEIKIFVPAPSGKDGALETTFTATTDRNFLTVTPSSGTIPPGGTTLTVTANPSSLPAGANTGTVTVTSGTATVKTTPVSVSLVTPVQSGGKSGPPPNSLIVPVVTHVNGANGQFLSDVRLTNTATSPVSYQILYTPTQTDATTGGKKTTLTVTPGQTIALNDIAKDFFGFGATGDPNDVGFGALEIRPVNTSSTLTYASSRTYFNAPTGTFGQFIAAVPFSNFATKITAVPGAPPAPPAVLSLQQIAQSPKFRTNVGIVEGSGTPVSGRFRIFDVNGTMLKEVPYSLAPGEHRQINSFMAANGIPVLEDGRIEITVDSDSGAVTAYASVLDNLTTDPLAVMPVNAATVRARRYVLPGMADLGGANNFHSDVRLYNGGATSVQVTPTYYPQGRPDLAVTAASFSIAPGQVRAFDNILPTLFNQTATGGAVLFTTQNDSSLVVTGRTYSIDARGGTFGQFIPAIVPTEGIGAGDRPLQILQLEQSASFRTNVGLNELTGNAARVRITIVPPDSRVSSVFERELAPNEFVQIGRIMEQVYGPGSNTYNARITIEVVGGTGRVTAYGSVVDNATVDPTYVPAQK